MKGDFELKITSLARTSGVKEVSLRRSKPKFNCIREGHEDTMIYGG